MEFPMYDFVTGPLAWIAFLIFFIGLIARTVWYFKGLNWQLDRVAYRPHMRYGIKGAVRSIVFWLFPYGSHSWRNNPVFTFLVFLFHIGLLITPVFLLGHNIMLKSSWGFNLPTLSETTADILTIAVIVSALFLVLRRVSLSEVRIITTAYDYLLIAIAVAPFVTGLMARYQVSNYQFWLIVHILCGEILLIAIPLTKLSHFILFFTSRAQLGMDYGIKRGGMKGKGFAW
jgi:nitrate reductase gamma subunit